jgi:hypothetical protein
VLKVLKTNSHPGKKPVLHPACTITNLFSFIKGNFSGQLVPALPPKCLVVMGNASYHSVIKEGTKTPTSATRKGDMQKWLKDKKNPFDGKMHTISIGLNSQWYGGKRKTS